MDKRYPDHGVCQTCRSNTLHSCLDNTKERIYLRTCTKCGRKTQVVDGTIKVLFMGRKFEVVGPNFKPQKPGASPPKEKRSHMRTAEFTHRDPTMVAEEIRVWKDDNHRKIIVEDESPPKQVNGQCRVIIRYRLAPPRQS